MVDPGVVALQVIGTLFGLVMLYLTFLYYRRETYSHKSLTVWFFIWILFIMSVVFPSVLDPVLHTFSISRHLDLFMIGGLLVFSGIVFYLFIVVKKLETRVTELVSKMAKDKPKKK